MICPSTIFGCSIRPQSCAKTTRVTLVTPAHAIIYGGNPELSFHVTRSAADLTGGGGSLHKIRLLARSSGWTDIYVDEALDPVATTTVAIEAGKQASYGDKMSMNYLIEGVVGDLPKS